ncbi:sodium:proton antiporter [Helicobacter enhydrae]|uniref:Sodium:proton antiporter n=1 Tax=Helicobacter enhydrae TaxID=222136 RepID=A0A1B1U569_9HELI|nr:cation:proton antiporter [Helicobacter enhydrae]ANV97900.1 sodium:proton antiporter [Helicobacter enhydrae]
MEFLPFAILAIFIALAPIVSGITKIPIVVVEMLLGALVTYFNLSPNMPSVQHTAEIGFLILMFLCGLEVDLKTFATLTKSLLRRVLMYFCLLYGISISLVIYFKLSPIYIATFPIMGVGMIMTLVREYGKEQPWLNLALRVAVLGELLSICVLVVLNGAYTYGLSQELYQTLGVLVLFLLFTALVFKCFKILFWWFPFLKVIIIPNQEGETRDLRFGAMLFFILISIVHLLDLEVVLGAFIAGMIISTFFGSNRQLHEKLNFIGFGFFVPFFFVYVGTTLDLKALFADPKIIKQALYILGTMIAIRSVSAWIAFRSYFNNAKHLVLYALSDAMPLTFLVATATLGLNLEIITHQTYYAFVLAAMIEGISFMILIKLIFYFWKQPTTAKRPIDN